MTKCLRTANTAERICIRTAAGVAFRTVVQCAAFQKSERVDSIRIYWAQSNVKDGKFAARCDDCDDPASDENGERRVSGPREDQQMFQDARSKTQEGHHWKQY